MTLSATDGAPLRRWLANIGTGYADAAVGGVIYLGLTPIVIRELGVEAYAVWLLGHAITFYLRFFDFGFGEAQVRLHARFAARGQQEGIGRLVATVAVALAITGAIAGAIGVGLALGPASWWIDTSAALQADFRIVLAILALSLLVSIPGSALENVYEGAQRFDLLNLRSIVLRVLAAAAQLTLLLSGHGVIALALVEFAVVAVGLVIDLIVLRHLFPGLMSVPAQFHRRIWKRIRHFSLWATIDDLIAEGTVNLDEILIASLLPLALMTPYALVATVGGLLMLAVAPLTETFFPMAAELHAGRRHDELRALLTRGTKLMLAIGLPLALYLVAFGPAAIAIWVPEVATDVTPALVAAIVLTSLVSVYLSTSTVMLLALNRIRLVVALTAVEVAIEVALIFALAPGHGLMGVALAGLAANAGVGLLFELPLICHTVSIPVMRLVADTSLRLLLASMPTVAAVLAMQHWLPEPTILQLLGAALTVAVVQTSAYLLVGLNAADRMALAGALRQIRGEVRES